MFWRGIVGGVVSGFFGVGGAFIAPPLLTTFFGLGQLEAQGLALALVSPSALLALVAYAGAGQVDWFVGIPERRYEISAIAPAYRWSRFRATGYPDNTHRLNALHTDVEVHRVAVERPDPEIYQYGG